MIHYALFVIAYFAIGLGRLFVPGHEPSPAGTYEALAHIWVGYMLCLIWRAEIERAWAVTALAVLTLLETCLFLNR